MTKTTTDRRFDSRAPPPRWRRELGVLDEWTDFDEPQNDAAGFPTYVGELRLTKSRAISADATLDEARSLLVELGASALPVVDALGFPVGVLSALDVLRELSEFECIETELGEARFAPLDPFAPVPDEESEAVECADGFHLVRAHAQPVTAIMSPVDCSVRESDRVQLAAEIMAVERVSPIPVVDAAGRLVGMLSWVDLAELIANNPLGWRPRR